METFNLDNYFKIKKEFDDAHQKFNNEKKELMKLIKSKENYERFLTHYCTDGHPLFSMTECSIVEGDNPNTYVIWWDDCFKGECDFYHTREISRKILLKFLNSDDYFSEIDKRLDSLKNFYKKVKQEENENDEYKIYLNLKAKYENQN